MKYLSCLGPVHLAACTRWVTNYSFASFCCHETARSISFVSRWNSLTDFSVIYIILNEGRLFVFYICLSRVERNDRGTQATIFLHIATDRFSRRKIVERSSGFLSSLYHWHGLKVFFLLFHFNFQVRKKNAGQSFLAMKEVQDNLIKPLSCITCVPEISLRFFFGLFEVFTLS